jgi:serine/threonine-protein kinase
MVALPQKIGRYEIRKELGRGMMGVVYEAHDPALTRTVALKTINPSFAASAEGRDAFERRFETEARAAGRLNHPNIVVVHDVGRDEETGILYIALERLHGEPLSALVREGERLPWPEVLEIGRQVADALEHLHAQGVVHRDIKPANIMRLPPVPGRRYRPVKLMDFGIAKVDTAQLTAAGQFFGTGRRAMRRLLPRGRALHPAHRARRLRREQRGGDPAAGHERGPDPALHDRPLSPEGRR